MGRLAPDQLATVTAAQLSDSLVLIGILVLAAIFSTFLFALSLVAYRQRRSSIYFLVTAAIGALVVRSAVGLGTVYGAIPMVSHHIIEHALDVVIALLLLWAIYTGGGTGGRHLDDVDGDSPDDG